MEPVKNMLARLREMVTVDGGAPQADVAEQERLATALLLAELARADYHVDEAEETTITGLLAEHFELDAAQTQELLTQAQYHVDGAVSLYDYVQTLNDRLDYPGRCKMVEMLWRVAYADGHLDKYEEHELRKIAGLLYVEDADFIHAKLKVIGAAS